MAYLVGICTHHVMEVSLVPASAGTSCVGTTAASVLSAKVVCSAAMCSTSMSVAACCTPSAGIGDFCCCGAGKNRERREGSEERGKVCS